VDSQGSGWVLTGGSVPNATQHTLGYSSMVRMTASDDLSGWLSHPDADRRRDVGYRRARRERAARRQVIRRRRRVAVLTLVALVAVAVPLISSVSGGSTAARMGAGGGGPLSIAAQTNARRPATHVHPAAPSPGSLPQTHAYPSGSSAQFKSLMASLWTGIVHDSVVPALAAFFPKGAYLQLKAISSASSDWTNRLVHDYGLDIAAAHALLGSNASHARLIRVDVPSSYGHWIQPGVCYNSIGYYEMPGARVVYQEDGQIRSFGIASMISWRGVWYVVHLGAILRSSDAGTVDDPSSGPGTSAYSGTC